MTTPCAHGCGAVHAEDLSVFVCGKCWAARQPLPDFKARVAELLREIEWRGFEDWCPACGKDGYHKDSCALAALLREASE